MKKHRILSFLRDTVYMCGLRCRLVFTDKTTLSALITSVLIFMMILQSLSSSAQDRSAIPVGMVDYDKSTESDALVRRVSKLPAFRVIKQSEEELLELLLDGMVYAVFVIEEGYEESLQNGNPEEVITMHYTGSNKTAPILSDILAGEILYPVSLYKSIRYYEGIRFDGTKHTSEEYREYIEELLSGDDDFDFAFHIVYEDPGMDTGKEEPISNSIIYNQLIFGILGILVSFIAMFILSGTVREKETGVESRLKISRFNSLHRDTGNMVAAVITEGVMAFLLSCLIYRQLNPGDVRVFFSAFLLILLQAVVQAAVFLLISKFINSIIVYQMVSSILILIMGGLGFFQLLTGLYQPVSDRMLNFIPNNWFIEGFTDIILYGGTGGIFKESHGVLLLLASVLLFLILVFDLIDWKTGSRYHKMIISDGMDR